MPIFTRRVLPTQRLLVTIPCSTSNPRLMPNSSHINDLRSRSFFKQTTPVINFQKPLHPTHLVSATKRATPIPFIQKFAMSTVKGSAQSIDIIIQSHFTHEIDELRKLCFPASKPLVTSRDEFDPRSQHIIININDNIAAYGRLTPGPNSVFENWAQGKATIPIGKNVIDFGRCLVNPQYRGLGLFELLCISGLKYAKEKGFRY